MSQGVTATTARPAASADAVRKPLLMNSQQIAATAATRLSTWAEKNTSSIVCSDATERMIGQIHDVNRSSDS